MNEFLFVFQILALLFFLGGALYLGKEALIVYICLCALLANWFVIQQITLFSLTVTASDSFIIGAMLGSNLLQEYYGKEAAKKGLFLSFFALALFLVLSLIHIFYLPAPQDTTHSSFVVVLQRTPRIIVSSISVFFLVQRWDLWFFSYLQKKFSFHKLQLRLGISLFVSQLLDTLLFSYLALYGEVAFFWHIVFLSVMIKIGIISASSWILFCCRKWILPRERAYE